MLINKLNEMKTKNRLSIIGMVIILGVCHSCGTIIFREVKCRDFEFQDDLKWYPGNVGNVISLSNKDNETKEFIIKDKYIIHTKKYTSDTGCGCHDIWGILLSTSNDTIIMNSESVYVENNKAKKYDYFFIKNNNKGSGFINEDKSIVTNYSIGNITFSQVLIFEYSHTENNQFKKIVIAPEIGVVELTETNGNIWKNMNLETKLNIDIVSFEYSEKTCE